MTAWVMAKSVSDPSQGLGSAATPAALAEATRIVAMAIEVFMEFLRRRRCCRVWREPSLVPPRRAPTTRTGPSEAAGGRGAQGADFIGTWLQRPPGARGARGHNPPISGMLTPD